MIINNNLNAERSVLSTLMDYGDNYDLISRMISKDDFESMAHQVIYAAITELAENNQPHDLLMISDLLEGRSSNTDFSYMDKRLAEVGAAPTAMPKSLIAHAELIRASALRRKSVQVAKRAIEQLENNEPTDEVNNTLVSELSNLEQKEDVKESYSMDEMLRLQVERMQAAKDGAATYIDTGFPELDTYMQMGAGDLVVVAARPSMGKTLITVNMQSHLAKFKEGMSVFFSLEMTEARVTERLTAAESSVLISKIKNAKTMNEDEWARVMRFMSEQKDMRFQTIEKSNITLSQIRTHLNKIKREKGKISSIAVDYLQIMGGLDGQDYVRRIGDVTRTLKEMGKEFGCPVFLISQLNRSVEQRPNKRPMLSDLRDSGTIEQDADIVLMLYRDDYYKAKDGKTDFDNIAEVIVAKNRNGETGTARLLFEGQYGRFANLIPNHGSEA